MTGKKAPKEPVNQMIKREATRRPSKAVSPPPEPQLTEDEDMLGSSERGCNRTSNQDGYQHSYNPECGRRNREGPHDGPHPRLLGTPGTLAVPSEFLISPNYLAQYSQLNPGGSALAYQCGDCTRLVRLATLLPRSRTLSVFHLPNVSDGFAKITCPSPIMRVQRKFFGVTTWERCGYIAPCDWLATLGISSVLTEVGRDLYSTVTPRIGHFHNIT